ncbi:hypothetical protein HPB48_015870 [Haemaphysalis longicornis]|uniref:YqaJ viral recombinase domain-containing protein n=1 Tax=Haemaphysalis longicornis TaxID=44386 RepID=A0A9J6H1R2_HAELO|nr:hypothetical protein HPB48_015870 [Haemaphysalis longicornis]
MRLSAYARDLRGAEKRRYLEKVAQCGGVDPYDYGAGDAALDMTLLPRVEFTDIKDYLVHATSFTTREALKAYKSMEGHNYLTSGWVQEPCVKVLADGRRVVLGKHLEGKRCSQVSFASARAKKIQMDAGVETHRSRRQQKAAIEETTPEEWSMFLSMCHKSDSRPALLSLEEPYAAEFAPVALKFPKAVLTNLHKDDVPETQDAMMDHCMEVMKALVIEPEVARLVEAETKDQAKSTKWFTFRAGRITASNAKAVCRTSIPSPSMSLLNKICSPEHTQFWAPQTAWGKEHEETARQAYATASASIHLNFQCATAGLHISVEKPFLAATPDGLVTCSCCGEGVLEVKCPYNGRNGTVKELALSKSACVSLTGGKLRLRTDHSYYYQVQLQMFVTQRKYCDFVLWTPKTTQFTMSPHTDGYGGQNRYGHSSSLRLSVHRSVPRCAAIATPSFFFLVFRYPVLYADAVVVVGAWRLHGSKIASEGKTRKRDCASDETPR